jgi:hypothetical protein
MDVTVSLLGIPYGTLHESFSIYGRSVLKNYTGRRCADGSTQVSFEDRHVQDLPTPRHKLYRLTESGCLAAECCWAESEDVSTREMLEPRPEFNKASYR